jgi:hypothetical protein
MNDSQMSFACVRKALCIASLLIASSASAAIVEAWFQAYNSGPGLTFDRSVGAAVDHFGNVAVTGQVADGFYTAKYAAGDGRLLWQQRFNPSYSFPTAVATDDRGNVLVSGYSANGYTAKYSAADGVPLWEQFVWDGRIQIQAMAVDRQGNVVVAGNSYVAKYAESDGRVLWEQVYDGNGFPTRVATDARGNVIVTGNRNPENNQPDYYTAKFAAKDGSLVWQRSYNGPSNGYDDATGLAIDHRGDVIVTGHSENADPTTDYKADYYTVKYAAEDGASLWEQRFNGPENHNDYARSLAMDRDGNVVVTGDSYFAGAFPHSYTVKYSAASGAVIWQTFYNGGDNRGGDVGAVAVDHRGDAVITGAAHNGVAAPEIYTVKYSGVDGSVQWEKHFSGPGTWKRIILSPQCLALGPRGMVAVTATTAFEHNFDLDFATLVYRPER